MNKPIDILYICDRKACENCHEECRHTNDINNAVNKTNLDGRVFEFVDRGDRIGFFELEVDIYANTNKFICD